METKNEIISLRWRHILSLRAAVGGAAIQYLYLSTWIASSASPPRDDEYCKRMRNSR